MPPPYGRGNWFHSRSSSSEPERDRIVALVNASHSPKFEDVRWSASTSDPGVIEFAKEISVVPSTMQTKIRQFIRLGFLKDDPSLPLKWTTLANFWRSLVEGGPKLKKYADVFEQLIISHGLALYGFDSREYCINPTKGYRPLLALLKEVDPSGLILREDFENMVGDFNFTYWRLDFIRGDILEETADGFKLTNKFPSLLNAVQTVGLPSLTDDGWIKIREDALDTKNPYQESIISEMGNILEDVLDIESILPLDQREVISFIVSSTNLKEVGEIDVGDYKISDTYSSVKTRRKQSAWSKVVRESYEHECCMPACDVNVPELIAAAHIKKYSAPESGTGHRANPKNGLCFCPLCHALFDKGYFTLTHDLRIEISSQVVDLKSQLIKNILLNSNGREIKPLPPAKHRPDTEFIDYHRKKVFKG